MNYLYNGVELPALPEWDKGKYPYAFIYKLTSSTYFAAYATAPHWNGYGITFEQGPRTSTRLTNGSWDELEEGTQAATSSGAIRPFWSNYDILNTDGSIYLAASTPVPVVTNTLDPTALLMGWMVGKRVAGLRKTQTDVPVVPDEPDTPTGDPVAYLYNGVRLPDINQVWTDKETYKYAVIAQFDVDALYLSTKPFCVDASGNLCLAELGSMSIYANDSGWQFAETATDYPANEPIFGADAVVWASADILNTDGTTYLAASEPIPVYE